MPDNSWWAVGGSVGGAAGARLPRFFAAAAQIDAQAGQARLVGGDVRHIRDVLRRRAGDGIVVCDGSGTDYICSIAVLGKAEIAADIVEIRPSAGEPAVQAVLWQCLPKGDKFDRIVRQTVEAGVHEIIPVASARALHSDLPAEPNLALEHRLSRWQRISEEAAKQSGRGRVPRVGKPAYFIDAVRQCSRIQGTFSIIPYEECAGQTLKLALSGRGAGVSRIDVFIGPEGGFAPEEVALAQDAGIEPVTLGPRILRTETAGLAAISAIMYEREA
ncbi:MAG: 16S rRNA (uracil(1498)-N(3))-methyltransferase [Clostridiales bacterium]|jgi:16S rRNA (uracil1498-N3)-methyltransferase|nr:16S rRNA (uracil(1498)-N(3))-methyltransferase [Clostridiales bacterium]